MESDKNNSVALSSSRKEFNKKCRRISIKNMPPGITNQDIADLLKPYHYQQIHIDKMSLSCKAVLLDGESACQCMNDLNMKMYRGSRLAVSLASCDFMLCVTQLPAKYTREQFLTLITPFGTPERCFLVHSELNDRSKGYGCVEFTSKESSIKAKNHLNGRTIGPYTLQVHWLDTIPQSYSGLHSCCLLVENLPASYKEHNALRDLFTHGNVIPVFCQSANCLEDDFSIIEYANYEEAEHIWLKMDNHGICGETLRVTFCVPGPCGLVILNSLKASRDLKRNNPSGGLLPTPVQKLDTVQFQIKNGGNSQIPPTTLPVFNGNMSHSNSHSDPEVQRLLKALQVRLLNIPDASLAQVQDMPPTHIHTQAAQINRQIFTDSRHINQGVDASGLCQPSVHAVTNLAQPRGRSASYDSGVHATDDEVFSSGSSSQEDVGRPQDGKEQSVPYFRGGKWNALTHQRPDGHFQVDYPSAFSHISSQSEPNRAYLAHRPVALACQKDLERSDSADSAYGGSQESSSSLMEHQTSRKGVPTYPYSLMKQYDFGSAPGHPLVTSSNDSYQRPFPRRPGDHPNMNGDDSVTVTHVLNGVPRPEFLFSSLCKSEDSALKSKEQSSVIGVGAAFTQHRSHLTRTPLPTDLSSPCFRRKTSFSNLMADLHDIGADSPTQLQLLGSSLMEGLLGDSPRSSIETVTESVNGSSGDGRLIRALNLFSPTECLSSPHTPASARKRVGGMLPSPEPSPEAGAYVGQHSQGLGGHYAGPLLNVLNLNKRRKSNET